MSKPLALSNWKMSMTIAESLDFVEEFQALAPGHLHQDRAPDSRGQTGMKKVSFWLIPVAEDRRFFQEVINRLAEKYGAAVFAPHVTVYSGHLTPDESVAKLVERATVGVQRIGLEAAGVSHTEAFTKTLFVQFQPSAVLRELSERIRRNMAQPSRYHLDPHLSLLYHPLNQTEKVRLAHSITIPKSEVYFDEVRAISTPGPTRTKEDVERWRELYQAKLERS